jgi:hypothetical protein
MFYQNAAAHPTIKDGRMKNFYREYPKILNTPDRYYQGLTALLFF